MLILLAGKLTDRLFGASDAGVYVLYSEERRLSIIISIQVCTICSFRSELSALFDGLLLLLMLMLSLCSCLC